MTTTTANEKKERFTPEIRAEIDRWIAKYPAEWKQSAVMGALMVVQDSNGGWLTTELMDQVATYLDMPPIAV
ncbi:MAG: NAD(P)H-dependent oxidoreductase subunit E, partial [Candidatus Thiodiazotropha endolucinida]